MSSEDRGQKKKKKEDRGQGDDLNCFFKSSGPAMAERRQTPGTDPALPEI